MVFWLGKLPFHFPSTEALVVSIKLLITIRFRKLRLRNPLAELFVTLGVASCDATSLRGGHDRFQPTSWR